MRICLCLSLAVAPQALAQQARPPGRDVVRAADDAFGRRVGIEDVGLYSESEVRGFDLQSAGNYRVEDHYFVRAAGLPLTLLDGTAIRVGANGLRTDFAAPSGVVRYDLPEAQPGVGARVETGWWGGTGPVLATRVTAGTKDGRLGIVGNLQISPWQDYTDGTGGDFYSGGIVSRWSPTPGVRLTGLLNRTWYPRGGDAIFVTADGAPPPAIARGPERSQPWMVQRTGTTQAGVMADVAAGGGWDFGASSFLSAIDNHRTFFNLVRLSADGGPAEAHAQVFGGERNRSISTEATAAKTFATGALQHRLIAMLRRRDSLIATGQGTALPVVLHPDVDAPVVVPEPDFAIDPRRKRDTVGQWAAGLGYRLSIGDAAELRADVQRARYTKRVHGLDGDETREMSQPWLYSTALTGAVTSELTAFASYARGLEEAGVAPGNALNRGTVLPAAVSRQAELGLKYRIPGGPALIAGLFDLAKPMPGLGGDGVYGLVGEVRHRGMELSIAGPITRRLSAVLGATWLDARIRGQLVERGEIGAHPINRPETIALANLTWRVPWIEGLAMDGGVNFRGERYADRANSATLPRYALFHAGLRQRFEVDGTPLTVRARIANLFDTFAWNASSSGLFSWVNKRVLTLTVTGEI
jgi:iron complex outermembrane receptor protein